MPEEDIQIHEEAGAGKRHGARLLSQLFSNNTDYKRKQSKTLMNRLSTRQTIHNVIAACILLTVALSSCDSAIYDNEGDCTTHHYVRFVYDYNMLNADAFAGNVKSVALFAFDTESHVLVKQWRCNIPDMAEPGWMLSVDVTPGATYDLLAWCGIDSDPAGFTLPETVPGVTTRDELTCTLLHDGQGTLDNDYPLSPMWYGRLDNVTFTDAEGTVQVETIKLTKDTNNIFIALQNLSGETMQEGLFEFTITDNTGLLSADNIPFSDNTAVTFRPYHTALGYAQYDPSVYYGDNAGKQTKTETDGKGNLCVAIAELSTNRLMADSKAVLQVRRTDTGANVFSLPLIDLALAIKGYQNRMMGDQEFLDRQDSYNMTFFLDKSQSWAGAVIMINSWRIVYNPTIFE